MADIEESQEVKMEITTGFRGGGIKITDIKVVQAGFLVPLQDTLIISPSYSVVGQPDFIFVVTLPFMWSLHYLRGNGKEHFLAVVLGKADDVLSELAELDTSEKEKLVRVRERQGELDALVAEIKSEIGLLP